MLPILPFSEREPLSNTALCLPNQAANGQIIAKAGWNYLLEGDGSGGIHNPTFTRDVINASIAALK